MTDTHSLSGRVAVVTGGARGIGRAIAIELAEAGASVAICDVGDGGQDTAARIKEMGGSAMAVPCDISEPTEVQNLIAKVIDQYQGIDILINNAGIGSSSHRLHELDIEDWDRTISVNLRGTFLCTKFAMEHLLQSSHAAIVNVASTYGIVGAPKAPAYCASKGAIVNLTRQLAVDYTPSGVRVNAILPGYIDTDLGGRRANMSPTDAAAAFAKREAAAALQPIGRQAQTIEVGRVAAFLCSDAASFMSGSLVTVDGGCTTTFYHGG